MIKLIGAGDSIMHFNKADTYPQTGWFQVIDRFLKEESKSTRFCGKRKID